MGAYKCATHGIQGFVICCDHVCDHIEAHRDRPPAAALAFESIALGDGYRFVRCAACTAAGVSYDLSQPAPALACSACFEAWQSR